MTLAPSWSDIIILVVLVGFLRGRALAFELDIDADPVIFVSFSWCISLILRCYAARVWMAPALCSNAPQNTIVVGVGRRHLCVGRCWQV